MIRRYTPKIIIKYLLKELNISILIFLSIFSTLIFLSNFIEELIFFSNKNLEDELIVQTIILSTVKVPMIIINMLPFIILFSSIFFYVKLIRINEIMPLSLSGFSKNTIMLIPAIYNFFIGILVVLILTPVSSELIKYYESVKQKYSDNQNLIIISNTGLWIREVKDNSIFVLRSDSKEKQNFKNLNKLTIYQFDKNSNFLKRIDGDGNIVNKKNIKINKAKIIDKNKNKTIEEYNYKSNIVFEDLKKFFSNSDSYSFWNILEHFKYRENIGYFDQELIIKFNKYLSLPIMLFLMSIISTIFTLKVNYQFNNFIYAFLGVITGIVIYFLGDLSIAMGKSGRLPLILSVWVPIILIMILSLFSIIRNND